MSRNSKNRTLQDKEHSILVGAVGAKDVLSRWDSNAQSRSEELRDNNDPSYRALTNLIYKSLVENRIRPPAHILDVGCGLGFFAADAARRGYMVDAIDPSRESVRIARALHAQQVTNGGLNLSTRTLEEFASERPGSSYEAIVANMTLHTVGDIQGFMFAAAQLLSPKGVMIATIPNPGVYLQSRSDIDVSGIDLRVEQTFEIDFRIRNREPHPRKIIYFHRPIRIYSVCADNAGIPLMESRVPEHVGPGRSRDIAVLEFAPSQRVRG